MALAILVLTILLTDNAVGRKCATLYNAQGYQGQPYSIGDGVKQPGLGQMNFVPVSVQVNEGCFLTIFDRYGNTKVIDRNTSVGWNSYQTLDAACCECDGCSGAASRLGNGLCARLYENPRCDSCSGFRLDMKDGDNARNFGVLNNRMTSVALKGGCVLNVYDKPEFGGHRFNYTVSSNLMGDNWYRQISSARCGCNGLPPITLPTVPTQRPTLPTSWTRPPMTLPTVPPRPPMTLPTVPPPPMTKPTEPPRTTTFQTKPPTTKPTTEESEFEYPIDPPGRTEESSEEEDEDKESEGWYGEDASDEIVEATTTTTTTTPKPTTAESITWGFEDEKEEEKEEEEDEDWGDW